MFEYYRRVIIFDFLSLVCFYYPLKLQRMYNYFFFSEGQLMYICFCGSKMRVYVFPRYPAAVMHFPGPSL